MTKQGITEESTSDTAATGYWPLKPGEYPQKIFAKGDAKVDAR